MIIIPKKEGMFGVDAIKRILKKMEEYKKYGTVFKKGRDISLIDCMIFFDLKAVDFLRNHYRETNKETYSDEQIDDFVNAANRYS